MRGCDTRVELLVIGAGAGGERGIQAQLRFNSCSPYTPFSLSLTGSLGLITSQNRETSQNRRFSSNQRHCSKHQQQTLYLAPILQSRRRQTHQHNMFQSSLLKQPVLHAQASRQAAFQPPRVVAQACCSSSAWQRPGKRQLGGTGGTNSSGTLHAAQHSSLSHHRSLHSKSLCQAFEGNNSGSKDPSLEDYVEVRIESVRVSQGASIVYLRVVGSDSVIPVHIGENESNALLREINKQRQVSQKGAGQNEVLGRGATWVCM